MFYYGIGTTFNVVLSLDELEAAVALLGNAAAMLDPEQARRSEWGRMVGDAMASEGKIHLVVTADRGDDSVTGFHGSLSALPEKYRTRAIRALTAIAVRYSQRIIPENVDCIGESASI